MENSENWEVRRQVPETDPIYQEERERIKNMEKSVIFGAEVIETYESTMRSVDWVEKKNTELQAALSQIEDLTSQDAQRISESISKNREHADKLLDTQNKFLRRSFETLARDLMILLRQQRFDNRQKFILDEVSQMFQALEIQDELKKHFGDDLSAFTARGLSEAILTGAISRDALYAAIRHHIEHVRKQEEQLDALIQETKIFFKEEIVRAVQAGELPETARAALARIDSVVVGISDRLQDMTSSLMGESEASGRIRVTNEQLQDQLISSLRRTLIHEFFHEISGRSITVHTPTENSPFKITDFYHKKVGIALHSPELFYSPNRWLNEAITEWLALELSGYAGDADIRNYKGSSAYIDEREELDRLFAAGLDEQLVKEAYFENFSSDQPKESRGQHFAALIKKIDELEGSAGFAKLENKHIMHEVEAALYYQYVYPADIFEQLEVSPATKVFHITMTVGTSEQTIITQGFFAVIKPIMVGDTTVSPIEEQWGKVQNILSYLQAKYGRKVKYNVQEKEPQ